MSELSDKKSFQALMFRLLDPLKACYSTRGARLRLGETGVTYDKPAIELEGFSRPLWALAPYWLGGGQDAADFEGIYRKGLAAGTDPQGPEYWGDTGDYDQCFVEMAAIACAILEVPEKVWFPLSEAERRNLAAWLESINHHFIPRCNWLFFQVLVNLALDSVGMPCDLQKVEEALDAIESYYKGGGWYTDGPASEKPQEDYYIPWAIQYYSVLYVVFRGEKDPRRAARFTERALEFGRSFANWFDANGAALPFGRSLSYRFAQCAFYSACVFAGLEPLPLPVMKGIIVRNLDWWLRKPIFDRDGVLTIGYCYPQMYMAERYNAPGSPYWAMKTFLLLGLPDDAPFWQAEAAPLPADCQPPLLAMPDADMLLQRLPDGQLNAYAAGTSELYGHGQFPEKYSKFVYNTRFGFSASRSNTVLEQAAPDNMLAFVIDDYVFTRKKSRRFSVLADRVISEWVPFPGITVQTEIIPCEGGHLRRHIIDSVYDCTACDCGFAVPKFADGYRENADAAHAEAANDQCGCTVAAMGETTGEGFILRADPNTSLYSRNTVIPAVRYAIPKGRTVLETKVTSHAAE